MVRILLEWLLVAMLCYVWILLDQKRYFLIILLGIVERYFYLVRIMIFFVKQWERIIYADLQNLLR